MEDMTKVIVGNNDQSKRRLPTWMQSNSTTKNEKCGNLDGIYSTSGKRKETRDAVSRLESMSSEFDVALVEKKKDPENKEKVSKKHTRKPNRGDGSEDSTRHFIRSKRKIEEDIIGMTEDEAESMSGEIDVALVEKKKDPENKEKVSKKHTREPNRGDGSEDSTLNYARNKRKIGEDIIGMTEDEEELAIEDLISIAEEFLSADKIKQSVQSVQSVTSKSKSFESNLISMSSSVTLEGKPNGAIRSCQLLSKCNQTSSLHLNMNQTSESTSLSSNKIIQSGDVALDMLELFLGPLLKNAPPRESDPEITRNTGLNL